jgi:hypothetical protein
VSENLKARLGLGDLATVVKVSQALSREIDIGKLIDTLMGLALEHAGRRNGRVRGATGCHASSCVVKPQKLGHALGGLMLV